MCFGMKKAILIQVIVCSKTKKIVIINKYFTDDVKFQKLLDILQIFDIHDMEGLSESSVKILEKLFPVKLTENLIPFEDGK
jgi:hypothetical protein